MYSVLTPPKFCMLCSCFLKHCSTYGAFFGCRLTRQAFLCASLTRCSRLPSPAPLFSRKLREMLRLL